MGVMFENKLDTVLVIDDEPSHTDWLTDYFESVGLKIENELDLQGALKALERYRYRYVVVDLSIPLVPHSRNLSRSWGLSFTDIPD